MLCSVFENQFAIVGVLFFSKYADLVPTMYEWSLMESLINFLRSFKLVTQFFQTENQVSISKIYPSLHSLQAKHTVKVDKDPSVVKKISILTEGKHSHNSKSIFKNRAQHLICGISSSRNILH